MPAPDMTLKSSTMEPTARTKPIRKLPQALPAGSTNMRLIVCAGIICRRTKKNSTIALNMNPRLKTRPKATGSSSKFGHSALAHSTPIASQGETKQVRASEERRKRRT